MAWPASRQLSPGEQTLVYLVLERNVLEVWCGVGFSLDKILLFCQTHKRYCCSHLLGLLKLAGFKSCVFVVFVTERMELVWKEA